jgi:hypothetical protein
MSLKYGARLMPCAGFHPLPPQALTSGVLRRLAQATDCQSVCLVMSKIVTGFALPELEWTGTHMSQHLVSPNLSGEATVVTGASRGRGQGGSSRMAEAGATVYALAQEYGFTDSDRKQPRPLTLEEV